MLKQSLPLTDRHLRILLLNTWGYSRESLAVACDVVPETMQALLVRIRRRAEPWMASSAFAGSHSGLRQFRWRVDARGEDGNVWRRPAMLLARQRTRRKRGVDNNAAPVELT